MKNNRTYMVALGEHLFLSAGLRCRTLLYGRHDHTAVCTLLLCAAPIASYSAVLAV